MRTPAEEAAEGVLQGARLSREHALCLLRQAERDPWPLLFSADRVRRRFRGSRVHLCSIAPVKVGRCAEDCRWCAQSAHWKTAAQPHGLMETRQVVRLAKEAAQRGAACFGLVTSGGRVEERELGRLEEMARAVRDEAGLDVCGSVGALDAKRAARLAAVGVRRYNHNLETSRAHFPRVCTTHTYEDRLASARAALEAGMELCCGGIFGIGETDADRVDLALAIRELGAHVVPLNFLHPIPGTPLQDASPLAPLKILSIVALFRLMLPDRTIKLAGGRERNLGELQTLMFLAGADGCLVGNYLTTAGRPAEEDLRLIRALGLEPARAGDSTVPAGV